MRAITVRDRDAGVGGLSLSDMPHPHAAENDVVVRVTAAGFTSGELGTPPTVLPTDGRAVFFVVEPDRARLTDLAQRLRDGRLRPLVGAVRPLHEAPAAFAPDRRVTGRTIIDIP